MLRHILHIFLYFLLISKTLSVTPSGVISIKQYNDALLLGSVGSFSSSISSHFRSSYSSYYKLIEPINDNTGCQPTLPDIDDLSNFVLLVARGKCTFEEKLMAAVKVGAKGVIIYNSLYGMYQERVYASSVDYDCDNGSGYVNELILPVYEEEMDSSMPSSCIGSSSCASKKCLVANETVFFTEKGIKVCCAWDLYMSMGKDTTIVNVTDISSSIALFIRMSDYQALKSLPELSLNTLEIKIYSRSDYFRYVPVTILFVIATLTFAFGSYRAATEEMNFLVNDRIDIVGGRRHQVKTFPDSNEDNNATINLNAGHALLFIVYGSIFLIVLYFFNLNTFVTFLYMIFSSLACNVIFIYPFVHYITKRYNLIANVNTDPLPQITSDEYYSVAVNTWLFKICYLLTFCLVIVWLIFRSSAWTFIIQDFMGVSVCFLCLSVIFVPNLKVATILLVLAFLYDVFFVFITPYIFSSSIMDKVATGGSNNIVSWDENYCEKYPDDSTYCDNNSLPMLFKVPSILFSYYTGETILGLGDVIIPGFMGVWAARHDYRQYGEVEFEKILSFSTFSGFFPMVVRFYSLGLLIANIAVYVFETGQPALFYIVPCVLGSILYKCYKNDCLANLWLELPPIKSMNSPIKSKFDTIEQERLLGIIESDMLYNNVYSSNSNNRSYQNEAI